MAAYFLDPADFSPGDLTAQGWTKRFRAERSWTKVSGPPDAFQSAGNEGLASFIYGLAHGTASPISSGVVQAATHCWHGGDFDSSGLAGLSFMDPTGGGDGNGAGIAIAIEGSTLVVRDAWSNTNIATATLGFSVGNGTKYWLRAEYDFSTQTVSAKAWQGAASDEPSGWQIEDANVSAYNVEEVVLFARRRASVHWFEFFSVGIDEPAPLEPGGSSGPVEEEQELHTSVVAAVTITKKVSKGISTHVAAVPAVAPAVRASVPLVAAVTASPSLIASALHSQLLQATAAVNASIATVVTRARHFGALVTTIPTIARKVSKHLAVRVTAVATFSNVTALKETLSATVTAVPALAAAAVFAKNIVATVEAKAALATVRTFVVMLGVQVAAQAALSKAISKILSVRVRANADLTGPGIVMPKPRHLWRRLGLKIVR